VQGCCKEQYVGQANDWQGVTPLVIRGAVLQQLNDVPEMLDGWVTHGADDRCTTGEKPPTATGSCADQTTTPAP